MQMKENFHGSCPDCLEEMKNTHTHTHPPRINVKVLDGFCHYCVLCDCFLQFQYTKVCPTMEISLIFRCSVCLLAQVCIGGEAAQSMRDVVTHLEAHDLYAGCLAKASVVEQHWNTECKMSGGQHSSAVPVS